VTRSSILLVDDHERWLHFVRTTLEKKPELYVAGKAANGLVAIQRAAQLQPDLILLDIGLPGLNGIMVARRIRTVSTHSKICFLTQESSPDVVQAALDTGAHGYVVKVDAGGDLLKAVTSVLQGNRYLSASIASRGLLEARTGQAVIPLASQPAGIRHEVGFYLEDDRLVADISRFIGPALKSGNAVIVVATALHRQQVLRRLGVDGFDVEAAIEHRRYLGLDAADAVSSFMGNGLPDPVRFLTLFGDLIATAADAAKTEDRRVTIFGEGVSLLWERGNLEAAIEVERLSNLLSRTLEVDILCGYSLQGTSMGGPTHELICAEHSAIYSD